MYIYIFSLKIIFDRLIKKHISWYKVIDIEKQIPENAFLSILAIKIHWFPLLYHWNKQHL